MLHNISIMNSIFKTLDQNYIKYGKNKIYVVIDNNNELWFSGKDSANSLGYAKSRNAISTKVDKEDIITYKDLSNILDDFDNMPYIHPMTVFINESGLYSLVLRSKLKSAKNFKRWITHDVLPAIRKYGSYRLKQEYEDEKTRLLKEINYLQEQNKLMKNDLRKNKYPDGCVFYVVDYSTEYESVYRIGISCDMKLRKKLYDTHTLHNHDVVIIKEHKEPVQLEYCMRSMLYDFRYRNKKDFYICDLAIIKKSLRNCIRSINQINKIKGGSKTSKNIKPIKNIISTKISLSRKRLDRVNRKIRALERMINK